MTPENRSALVASALAGLLSGTLAACGGAETPVQSTAPAAPAEATQAAPAAPAEAAPAEAAPAADAGATANQDAATGTVAPTDGSQPVKVVPHGCKGKNECKGQGGCKTGDNGCKGKNSCKGKGGCASAPM